MSHSFPRSSSCLVCLSLISCLIDFFSSSSQSKYAQLITLALPFAYMKIGEGLVYLHYSGKIIHRNLSPQSIIINKKGIWRLAGFEFIEKCGPDSTDNMVCISLSCLMNNNNGTTHISPLLHLILSSSTLSSGLLIRNSFIQTCSAYVSTSFDLLQFVFPTFKCSTHYTQRTPTCSSCQINSHQVEDCPPFGFLFLSHLKKLKETNCRLISLYVYLAVFFARRSFISSSDVYFGLFFPSGQ